MKKIVNTPWLALVIIAILAVIGCSLEPIFHWYIGVPVLAIVIYITVRCVAAMASDNK